LRFIGARRYRRLPVNAAIVGAPVTDDTASTTILDKCVRRVAGGAFKVLRYILEHFAPLSEA
jgi:hypothetical protein